MKTRDLIAILQAADPTGEAECVVGCNDIYSVEPQPMYYDGRPTLLVRDVSKLPYYNIVGLRIPEQGAKVRINTMDAESVFIDHPEMPVIYDTHLLKERYGPGIEEIRTGMREMIAQIDAEHAARKKPAP